MRVNPTNNEIDTEIDKLEQSLHDVYSVPPVIYTSLESLIRAKARADQFREDTDERVQSIKETRIETIKQMKALLDGMLKEVD